MHQLYDGDTPATIESLQLSGIRYEFDGELLTAYYLTSRIAEADYFVDLGGTVGM